MFSGHGVDLGRQVYALGSERRLQIGSAFATIAGVSTIENGYATIRLIRGSGLQAFASVVDNLTNNPTTVSSTR